MVRERHFDGYSVVAGHEYAEAVADPDTFRSYQDGWDDAGEARTATGARGRARRIVLGSHGFPAQPMWSNEAHGATGNGCVVSR